MPELPAPECPYGYPKEQLEKLFGTYGYQRLGRWMVGQTMAICDGLTYSHEDKRYYPSPCADNPHGPVVYTWDLRDFVSAPDARVIDW